MKLDYVIEKDDFDRAGEASGSVKKILSKLGVAPPVVKRVAIAMYEAEINAFIHGGGGEAHVEIDSESVRIQIIDSGKGIEDLELAMQEGWSTADENVRKMGFGAGMGLPNIKKYTDEMNIDTVIGEGTTITLKVYNK